MAINAKQMQAFANKGGPKGGAPAAGELTGKHKADDHGAAGEDYSEEDHNEEGEPAEQEHEEDNGDARFDVLKQLLEEHAEDLEAAAEELDPADLAEEELPAADEKILHEAIGMLDKKLRKELQKTCSGGISREEADELADHLAEEEKIEMPEQVAGWLYHVARLV